MGPRRRPGFPENEGTNSSVSSGLSGGSNWSRTKGKTYNDGRSWTPTSLFLVPGFGKANLQKNDSRSWSDSLQHRRIDGLEQRAIGRRFPRHVAVADRRDVGDVGHQRNRRHDARHVAVAHRRVERDHSEARRSSPR